MVYYVQTSNGLSGSTMMFTSFKEATRFIKYVIDSGSGKSIKIWKA
jgi:hypothetical protein